MLPACNRGVGANLCAPDVCKTPPPPVVGHPQPYVNRAAHAIAVPFSPTTFICGLPALHLLSKSPVTTGDEPGIFGPGPMRVGAFVVGNPIVFVDGIPGVNLTCVASGNQANAMGAALVPDAVNVFYTLADGAGGGRRDEAQPVQAADLVALRASLDDAPPPLGTMLDGGIAILRIAAFGADVSTRVYNEVRRLQAAGMGALVLDLRGNPGGELDACLALAADFLPAGTRLAIVVDADGDETLHRSQREHPYEMPVAVLVDRGTASAAELFAASLQVHGRAVVVGERTYGKGSAQQVLPDRGAMGAHYATVATFLRPDGGRLDGRGVVPDVAVRGLTGAEALLAAVATLTLPTSRDS
jgi:carboxyl-terminal processing protease